jgi:fucose permease
VLAFFLYTGLEYSVGQWSYTLLREGRGLEPGRAALWVSLYWGGFTGGRVVAGLLPLADRTAAVLRLCSAGMAVGAALAALGHGRWPTPLGLLLVGLSFAPIYPALVASTPARIGRRHSANAMGFQVAAATAGMAAIPALIGVAARRLGLEAIARGWVLCALAALSVLLVLAGEVGRGGVVRRGTMSGNS